MTRHYLPAAAIALALLIPHHSTTAAKPSSNFVDLGHLGGGFSSAFAINNNASSIEVTGQSTRPDGCSHAFFWTAPGPMVDLGTFGGGNSYGRDINDHGMIAGGSEDANRRRWAAVWRRSGATWTIENLGTVTGACCASAYGINNGTAGDPGSVAVVGSSAVSGHSEAAVWTMSASGWAVQTLGTLSGDTYSSAHDVNDAGTIVGLSSPGVGDIASAFRWTAATGMSRLPGLGGALTYALAINNSGDVAGLSTDAGGRRHAVRWRASTGWTVEDLGTLGGCCSEAYGINTFGDVAGVSNLGKRSGLSGTQHGFVARPGSLMIDLAAQGQSAARDLNDFGVVVGEGGGGSLPHAVIWRLP